MIKVESIIAELNVKKVNGCKYITEEDVLDIISKNGVNDIDFLHESVGVAKTTKSAKGNSLYVTNDLIKKFKLLRD